MGESIVAINYIAKTPGFREGEPHIAGRHISVEFIASLYINHAVPAEEIARNQELTPAQVHAAISYYYDHPDEIQAIWDEHDRIADKYARPVEEVAAEKARLEARMKERNPEGYAKLIQMREEAERQSKQD